MVSVCLCIDVWIGVYVVCVVYVCVLYVCVVCMCACVRVCVSVVWNDRVCMCMYES